MINIEDLKKEVKDKLVNKEPSMEFEITLNLDIIKIPRSSTYEFVNTRLNPRFKDAIMKHGKYVNG